jgi:hypothetical protein
MPYTVSPFANGELPVQVYPIIIPHKPNVVGEFEMEEIVTPVGNGLYKLFGVPTDLNVTVVPTIRFEISFT